MSDPNGPRRFLEALEGPYSAFELEDLLKELLGIRLSGAAKVKYRDRETWFAPGPELDAAIIDCERRLAVKRGYREPERVRTVRVFTSKGI